MASQNIARLGVVLGLDSGELVTELEAAQKQFKKFSNDVKRDTNDAAKEILALEMATKRYGQVLTREQELQLQFDTGRFKYATETTKKALLEKAKAYDAVAASAAKANKAQGGLTPFQQQAIMYQTTDTITSLLGGQNPLMVLMQQGGQLKDQFGGLGPMFKGLAASITPVGVAVTAFGGSILGLGYAMYQGSEESKKFNNSLKLTGGYLNMTESQFTALSQTIASKYHTSLGDTREAMQAVVSSGKFTTQTFTSVSEAIARVSKLSGESAATVAQNLIPSLDGSASSAARLNSQYHFLTFEQYKHIEALEKQGKKQDAIKATADALNVSLNKQSQELGSLEKMWNAVTEGVNGFWQSLKNIGKTDLDKQIAAAYSSLDIALRKAENVNASDEEKAAVERARAKYQGLVLQRGQKMAADYGESVSAAENEAKIEFDKKYASQLIDLSAQTEELKIKARYEKLMTGADKIKQLELQKEMETELAKIELRKKIAANPQLAGQLTKNAEAKALYETTKLAREQRDISRDEIENYRKKAVAEQDSIDKEKERLDVYKQNLLASDSELQIALSRLKTEQEIAEIMRNKKLEADPAGRDAEVERLRQIQKSREAVIDQAADLKKLQDMNQSVFNNMGNAIDNFVKNGKLSFKDLTRSIIQDLISIAMKAQMMAMFKGFNFFGGGWQSNAAKGVDVGGYTSSLAGFADGGSPPVGVPSIVGERGPELFIPNSAGTIIPNGVFNQMLGGGGQTVNYNGPYIANMSAIDTQSSIQFLSKNKQAVWAANQSAQRALPVSR